MLKAKNIDKRLWAEAAMTANQLRNLSPTSIKETTPEEEFSGRSQDLTKIKTFGSKTFAKIKKEGKKLDDQAVECIMLGYDFVNSTYRLWEVDKQKIRISRDIN